MANDPVKSVKQKAVALFLVIVIYALCCFTTLLACHTQAKPVARTLAASPLLAAKTPAF